MILQEDCRPKDILRVGLVVHFGGLQLGTETSQVRIEGGDIGREYEIEGFAAFLPFLGAQELLSALDRNSQAYLQRLVGHCGNLFWWKSPSLAAGSASGKSPLPLVSASAWTRTFGGYVMKSEDQVMKTSAETVLLAAMVNCALCSG
jgi:hypothetical protein